MVQVQIQETLLLAHLNTFYTYAIWTQAGEVIDNAKPENEISRLPWENGVTCCLDRPTLIYRYMFKRMLECYNRLKLKKGK